MMDDMIWDKYQDRIKPFKTSKPNKDIFTNHTLTPIKVDTNPYIYLFKEMKITSYFEPNGKFFELSSNEILSIMEYYGLAYPEIQSVKINHYTQPAVQGMASRNKDNNKKGLILFIPTESIMNHFDGITLKNIFESSLCVLLHEISHLLGNTLKDKNKCEPEADRFAIQEYKKWLKIL